MLEWRRLLYTPTFYCELIVFSDTAFRSKFSTIAVNNIPEYHFAASTDSFQCLPLYVYDKDGNPHDNITDWALNQFQNHYSESKLMSLDSNGSPIALAIGEKTAKAVLLQKQGIFYYVYAVLHNPAYRKKYQQNLKREFPAHSLLW